MTDNVITKSFPTTTAKDTEVYDLPESFADLFNSLSEARYNRMEAEKVEKAAKAQILAVLPERKRTVKFVLRVSGVIRASVSLRARTVVSAKELLAAFPEAYAATSHEVEYDVIDPA